MYPLTFVCIVSSLRIVIRGAVQLELRRRGGRLLIAKNEGEARAAGRQEGRTSALLSNLIDCTNCHNNVLPIFGCWFVSISKLVILRLVN